MVGSALIREGRRALRATRTSPAFSAGVVVVLGVALALAIAMAVVIHGVLVRALPVSEQERLIVLTAVKRESGAMPTLLASLEQIALESRQLKGIAGVGHWGTAAQPYLTDRATIVVRTSQVSSNFFELLGATALHGRLLRKDDERSGALLAAVLSQGAWRSRFGSDPGVVGSVITDPYTGRTFEIVGVAAQGLDYPIGVEMWTTIPTGAPTRVIAVGRLSRTGTAQGARSEFVSLAERLLPEWRIDGASVSSFADAVFRSSRTTLAVLATAVALLLVLASANTGALFLVRGMARREEHIVRRALGARSRDIVLHIAVEGGVLACGAGVLGGLLAVVILRQANAFASGFIPRLGGVLQIAPIIGASLCLTVLVVSLFGVLPAVALARAGIHGSALAFRATPSVSRGRASSALVVVQVAIAVVLVAGAGLLVRGLKNLQEMPRGYRTNGIWLASVAFDFRKYDDAAKQIAVMTAIEERVRNLAGVEGVTPLLTQPLGGATVNVGVFEAEGTPDSRTPSQTIAWEGGGSDYFNTFEIPLVRGRVFGDTDRSDAVPVVVVSEGVARKLWPGGDPIGQRIRFSPSLGSRAVAPSRLFEWRTVIGVVAETRFRTLDADVPTVYLPYAQIAPGGYVAVRFEPGADARVREQLQEAFSGAGAGITLWNVQSMTSALAGPLAGTRLSAFLMALFGLMAVLLSVIGAYSAMSELVRQQTRSIGIRAALGATPSRLCFAVLRRAMVIAFLGVAAGISSALVLGNVLAATLSGIHARREESLAGAALVLLLGVMIAAYLPARRATRVDPMLALRG